MISSFGDATHKAKNDTAKKTEQTDDTPEIDFKY